MEIESDEDDEGDLQITSEDSTVKFEKEEPQMHFRYATKETENEFEANDFALIEFVDENDDGKIHSDGIKQKLEFDEVLWSFAYEKMVEDNNTIITVTYYANSTEYEISLVMKACAFNRVRRRQTDCKQSEKDTDPQVDKKSRVDQHLGMFSNPLPNAPVLILIGSAHFPIFAVLALEIPRKPLFSVIKQVSVAFL